MEKNFRVFGTCTTIPTRYKELEMTLKSIKEQSLKLEKVFLALPKECARLKMVYKEPSEQIKQEVEILRPEKDYGPLTKLYGALVGIKDPEAYIFSFDDDIHYPKNYLEKLVKFSKEHPDSVVSGSGINLKYGVFLSSVHTNLEKVSYLANPLRRQLGKQGKKFDVIMGFSGVLYPRKVFPMDHEEIKEFFEKASSTKSLFLNDDIYISAYLSNKKVGKFVTSNLPLLRNNNFIDVHSLSSNFIKMLFSMNKAVKDAKKLGFEWNFNDFSFSETYLFPYLLLVLLVVLIIIEIWIITRLRS
jgi:hypothetical protein